MTRLVICTGHDLVLFSGVSVVKDARSEDAPASTRRAILPVKDVTNDEPNDEPKDEPKHEPKHEPVEANADAEVSDTAPTLVPPRPSGMFPILRLRVDRTGESR